MKVVETTREMQALAAGWRRAGDAVGFVPTMGALHAGHVSLVRAARADCDRVVVSIFVNPTQFNDPRDLAAYPVDLAGDLAALEPEGVSAVFHPGVADMYPGGLSKGTTVHANPAVTGAEGRRRPGHFDGVATVVTRLFHAVTPDRAYFGEKDWNQLAVVQALVRDLGFGMEIVGCPTVREADGLALSSRNRRLASGEREAALGLVRALAEAQRAHAAGERDDRALVQAMLAALGASPGLRPDYAVVDGDRALVAAFAGDVRLIDNASLATSDLVGLGLAATVRAGA